MAIQLSDLPLRPSLRVLLVEDSEDDAALVLRELRRGGYEMIWERVDTGAGLTEALARQWDLVLCDYVMPQFSALAALQLIRARNDIVPVIIVSGEVGEDTAVGALKHGAHDFVSKNRLARLVPAVERELREAEDRRARKRAEAALRDSEARFRTLIENALDIIAILDADGTYRYASPSHERASGFTPAELVGRNGFDFIHPDDAPRLMQLMAEGLATGRATAVVEYRFRCKDGSWRYVEGAARNLIGDSQVQGVIVNARDITERKRTEQALRQSEERFRTLVENLNDIVFSVDLEGKIAYISPTVEQMFGRSPAALQNRAFLPFVHPDDRAGLLASQARTMAGQLEPSEFRVVDGRGGVHWVRTSSRPQYENGQLVGTTGVLVDITTRKQAEEQLRESEERYRSLVSAMSEGVVLQAADGRIVACNASAERILGLSADELLGRTSVDPRWNAIHEDGSPYPGEDHPVMRTLRDGRPCSGNVMGVHKPDGSLRWISINVEPLCRPEETKPYAVVATFVDITERRNAENEIRRLNVELESRVRERTMQLEAANEELEAFSYSVSHDLRTPLRAISGFSRILLEDHAERLDAQAMQYLGRIRSATERMQLLIGDLLNLSRVSRAEVHWQVVDLGGLAGTIAAELRRVYATRVVRFVVAPGLVVRGDARLLHIVMENLLDNAWKYTSKNAEARIELGVHQQDGECVYFLRDDGAGFDMAWAGKLFHPFQRLHAPTEFEGTGIGLATVQRIIHRHGGRIWAEGAVDRGATFYFTLGAGDSPGARASADPR